MTLEEFWWLHSDQVSQARPSVGVTRAEMDELDRHYEALKEKRNGQ